MEFERPRGTRDFLFEEMRERKHAEDILRNVFENYGFGEVQTPLFEDLKLFTTKSGEEIVDQLYNFKDKGDRDLALRPEITAPIARLYLNELQKTSKPIKIYYYGSCFRYERPHAYHGGTPFILSGGIGPDDAEKVKNFQHPMLAGIDLNSRFETAPALKDIHLINDFLEQSRII